MNPPSKLPAAAQSGDRLILADALGSGVYTAACAAGIVIAHADAVLGSRRELPAADHWLACLEGVHALVQVGAEGLLRSLAALCRASGTRAALQRDHLPRLPEAIPLLESGLTLETPPQRVRIRWAKDSQPALQQLLKTPESLPILLVACRPDTVTEVLSILLQEGFNHAAVIGELAPVRPWQARISVD